MTVTNTNLRNDYTGNGSTTVYSFTFTTIYEVGSAKYSLKVITTDTSGVESLRTQGTDYTVTLASNGTGTITFATAPTTGHKITILPDMSLTQETDYIKSGSDKFPAESHEKALDKLTLIAKQFSELFKRTIKLPNDSLLSEITIPVKTSNADKAVVVNSTGDGLDAKSLLDINTYPITAFAETLLTDTSASEARSTLGLVIGTNVQAYHANLNALSGLVGAANKLPYFTGAGAMALMNLMLLPAPITIANNSTDANNDIDFSAGNFQFSDVSGQAALSAITKRLDASWTAGTNQGGLFSGSKANSTWYHCFAIYNPTTGVSDAGFDTSVTAANIPSGYTKYKRVGSIRTDGSGNILAFFQFGNRFYLSSQIEDRALAAPPSSPTLLTVTLPLGISTIGMFNAYIETGSSLPNQILFAYPLANTTASTSNHNLRVVSSSVSTCSYNLIEVATNTSSQISIDAVSTNGSLQIITQGWIDYQL